MPASSRASGATTPFPVIDISSFLTPDSTTSQRRKVAHDIHVACKDTGFFYLVGHGVPKDHLNDVLDQARTFFALPSSEKDAIALALSGEHRASGRGYQRLAENVTVGSADYHEGIDLYKELAADHPLILRLASLPDEERQRQVRLLALCRRSCALALICLLIPGTVLF